MSAISRKRAARPASGSASTSLDNEPPIAAADEATAVRVCALSRNYPSGWFVGPHCHKEGQFIHATTGVMEIRAGRGLWLVPRGRALWMPPRFVHELHARGEVSLRTLYLSPEWPPAKLGAEPKGYAVTPLLRELIVRAVATSSDEVNGKRYARLIAVLRDELSESLADELSITMPQDARLERACHIILADPGATRSLSDLAILVGASPRTLIRLANKELGCSFSVWRQQARILSAVPMLVAGEAVTSTALTLGYETPSAFAAMFKRFIGASPRVFAAMEKQRR